MRRTSALFIATLAIGFPAQASAYDWSGFYVGANAGYGHANADWTNRVSTVPFADYLPGATFSHGIDGLTGGGQVGYNFQRGRWVYGVEAMFDVSAIAASRLSDNIFSAMDDSFEARVRALALVSGRLGYAWDNLLAYAKAGFALANVKASVSDASGVTTGAGSDSQWRSGPAFGMGIEYGVTPSLSIGIEYDYIRLSAASYQLGGGAGSYLWDVDVRDISIVLARLNYHFNGLR
jgi:outer membrane immunogenic protein